MGRNDPMSRGVRLIHAGEPAKRLGKKLLRRRHIYSVSEPKTERKKTALPRSFKADYINYRFIEIVQYFTNDPAGFQSCLKHFQSHQRLLIQSSVASTNELKKITN